LRLTFGAVPGTKFQWRGCFRATASIPRARTVAFKAPVPLPGPLFFRSAAVSGRRAIKLRALFSEPELLRAMFDVGYFPPNTPPDDEATLIDRIPI